MVFVVSLVSSPGAGKTAFLEKTLTVLHQPHRVAALVGDPATEMMLPAWPAATLRSSRSPRARCAILRLQWCRMRLRDGRLGNWIFCLWKMWVIWCAHRLTIWEKTCDWFCCR